MSVQRIVPILLLIFVFCLASCGGSKQASKVKKVPLTLVKGTVTVDGEAEQGVKVTFNPVGEFEPKEHRTGLVRTTNDKGEYVMGTYELADGLPPGEYALTFVWSPNEITLGNGPTRKPTDKFEGKYSDAKNPVLKVTVESGKPLVVEQIELKTK